jgi:hypothetical protein
MYKLGDKVWVRTGIGRFIGEVVDAGGEKIAVRTRTGAVVRRTSGSLEPVEASHQDDQGRGTPSPSPAESGDGQVS